MTILTFINFDKAEATNSKHYYCLNKILLD